MRAIGVCKVCGKRKELMSRGRCDVCRKDSSPKFIGDTKLLGNLVRAKLHVSDDEYKDMMAYLRNHSVPIPSLRFGDGSNTRMRRIAAYNDAVGIININGKNPLSHGHKRGVYFHHAVPPETRGALIQQWYEQWGLPRYERTKKLVPPYQDGLSTTHQEAAAQV